MCNCTVIGVSAACRRWIGYELTNVDGCQQNAANILSHCLAECVGNPGCTGIDWSPGEPEGGRCWLAGSWASGPRNNGTSLGTTHYDLDRGCAGQSTAINFVFRSPRKLFYVTCRKTVPTVVSHLVVMVGLAPMTRKISKIWRVGAN